MTKNYDISDNESLPTIMNWLGHEGLHFVQTLTDVHKICKSNVSSFSILNVKFKPQQIETILSLQYCKLSRDENKSAEEWLDSLRVMTNECNYKEHNRKLKEQFINGTDGKMMTTEELTTIRKPNDPVNRYLRVGQQEWKCREPRKQC